MKWTAEQKRATEIRGKNLLVSAAAGSGKTAVLVDRIIKIITDEKEPVSIDRLLVMTFTRAAAGEMRERISEALRQKLKEDRDNRYLKMQAAMLPRAKIATIDSICSNLIKQNYQELDIDPSFRVAEEGELKLLKNDILKAMFEEKYAEKDNAFSELLENIAEGRSDAILYEIILKIYDFISSYPFKEIFFKQISDEKEKISKNDLESLPWMRYILEDIRESLDEYEELLREAERMCLDPSGPLNYLSAVEEALDIAAELREALKGGYGKLREALRGLSFEKLKAVRSGSCDEEFKEAVKTVRNDFKDMVRAVYDEYLQLPYEKLLICAQGEIRLASLLSELTAEFMRRFEEEKTKRNIVDFSDLEHMALRLLWRFDEEGRPVTTELADRLSEELYEILIDEYQDSNYVQEYLVRALSGERFGRPDVFVVGDVKQSIYRFRLAKPEIFTDKYYNSTDSEAAAEDDINIKVELNRNFRSREKVLSSVNALFSRIMRRSLGGVEYDEAAELRPGIIGPFEQDKINGERGFSAYTELIMVTGGEGTVSEELEDMSLREAEERLIAAKIKELVRPDDRSKAYMIRDKRTMQPRPVEYRDIVILMRSPASSAKELVNILSLEAVPAYAETVTGWFNAIEVELMISMLEIIDNPIQDIPLAAVLKSPVGGFGDEELAVMRGSFSLSDEALSGDESLYSAMINFAERYEMERDESLEIEKKAYLFNLLLEELREYSLYHSVGELITEIYERTGYYAYASAMPLGDMRKANLNMLLSRAESYEHTSFKGLFNFVRYIEELKKYDTDYGEASVYSEEDNIVRISSIHKSKGLEYPIVILSGLDRRFNRNDGKDKLLVDSELGMGMDYTDLESRIRYPSAAKKAIRKKLLKEGMGEELRVLYVAMTRASEKLIMTAAVKDTEKAFVKARPIKPPASGEKLMRSEILKCGSFLEVILKGCCENSEFFDIKTVSSAELVSEELSGTAVKGDKLEDYRNVSQKEVSDPIFRGELMKALGFRYSFREDTELYPKRSVSEIKHEATDCDFDDASQNESLYSFPDLAEIAELTGRRGEANEGAQRGTAYHRVFELLDLSRAETVEDVLSQLKEMRDSGKLSEEEYRYPDPGVILRFCSSHVGQLMKKAFCEGRLYRERHFMIGRPARELTAGSSSEEMQLLQGIIDAYIENDEGIILIDYKTDRIRGGEKEGGEELKKKYALQLELYGKALEQLTGKTVIKRIIYSTELGEEIEV